MLRRLLLLLLLSLSHIAVAAIGFMAGIYLLPTIIEPAPPEAAALHAAESAALFSAEVRRDHPGSDFLHWGEGRFAVGKAAIAMRGELAPGPDYKLYLSRRPVGNAAEFEAVKAHALRLGDVRAFHGFIMDVPPHADVEQYNTVVIWCETFRKFITAATYR